MPLKKGEIFMLYNIKYVYGKDKADLNGEAKSYLNGAIVELFDGERTRKQEIYVGLQFCLEDILENEINARCLKINDVDKFKALYEELGACGIVYFPDTDKYGFLQEGDIVLPWTKTEEVKDTLENALNVYRNEAANETVKQKYEERKALLRSLDPDDALVELNGLSLSRRVSSR